MIVLATLCLKFSSKAQTGEPTNQTKPALEIGQKVPDLQLSNLSNYKTTTATISEFKGKLLILDFWATWCGPCVAMIPKMDSLQNTFKGKIQFLSVTYQNQKEVGPFMQKFEQQKGEHYDIPILSSDTRLKSLFPYRILPHYVWIGPDGRLKAITSQREITSANISAMLSANPPKLPQKQDIENPYDRNKPLFIAGNGGDAPSLIQHSVFSGYVPGLASTYNVNPLPASKSNRITLTNLSIVNLFASVFEEGKTYISSKRIKILSKDSLQLSRPNDTPGNKWLPEHAYCYELIVPQERKDQLYEIAKADLARFFPDYQVYLQKMQQPCMVLTRTGETDQVKSKGGPTVAQFSPFGFTLQNQPLSMLVSQLNTLYQQYAPYWIEDQSGYPGMADLKIIANLSSMEELNKALKPYGLQFIKKDVPVEMLIIADAPANTILNKLTE